MLEELQEADVLWSAASTDLHSKKLYCTASNDLYLYCCEDDESDSPINDKQSKGNSAPIDIPKRLKMVGDWRDEDENVLGEMMIPPHILISRRVDQEMVGSVYGGGEEWRKLNRLRVHVLNMTGFLEGLS